MGKLGAIYQAAEKVLFDNLRKGTAIDSRGRNEPYNYVYVCPSPSVYPHQWLWDSCFHAIVMARFDGKMAQAELATIMTKMRPDGFIPHLVNWNRPVRGPIIDAVASFIRNRMHHANLTQPPVLGIAMEEIFKHTGDREFLERYLPLAKRHYQYLTTHRDPDGDGLVSIIFPIESGMDHSPIYDAILGMEKASALGFHIANLRLALRYLWLGWNLKEIFSSDAFSVEDLAFNCIYASGLRSMARLCQIAGDSDAVSFEQQATNVERAIIHRCYNHDDDIFYSLYSKHEVQIQVKTVASLMPLILEGLPSSLARRLVDNYLLKSDYYWTPYPIPSVSVSEDGFSPSSSALSQPKGPWQGFWHSLSKYQMVWRGPTWVNTNWFLARGLRLHGFTEIADELTASTAKMVAKAGFWEFYNPITGEGLGATNFGWSTLVVDMLDNCPPLVRASILQLSAA